MVEEVESTPIYCSECRSGLQQKKTALGYDVVTGETIWKVSAICPKRAWWKFSDHDVWERTSTYNWEKQW